MGEENKEETVSKSFRLPRRTVETLERWGLEGEISPTQALVNCVDGSVEAEKALQDTPAESAIQEGDCIAVPRPTDRNSLADGITMLIEESRSRVHESYIHSALGIARTRVTIAGPSYLSPEYRQANKLPAGDVKHADRLRDYEKNTLDGKRL